MLLCLPLQRLAMSKSQVMSDSVEMDWAQQDPVLNEVIGKDGDNLWQARTQQEVLFLCHFPLHLEFSREKLLASSPRGIKAPKTRQTRLVGCQTAFASLIEEKCTSMKE